MRAFLWLLALNLIYLLVVASSNPWDVAFGAIIGLFLLSLFGRFIFSVRSKAGSPWRRLIAFLPFVWKVLTEALSGAWGVVLFVLRPRKRSVSGVVSVPMGSRTSAGVVVTAFVETLSPGSVLVDLDWDRREMLFHFVDASDPVAIRDRLERFYNHYQKPVFP